MGRERKLSAFERAVQHAIGDGRQLGAEDDPLRSQCPLVWAWLSTVYVGRDSLKNPATLSIRLGPEGAQASLVDRDLCCSVEVASLTVAELLPALELALASPAPPVKSWGKREPHLRRRKSV